MVLKNEKFTGNSEWAKDEDETRRQRGKKEKEKKSFSPAEDKMVSTLEKVLQRC